MRRDNRLADGLSRRGVLSDVPRGPEPITKARRHRSRPKAAPAARPWRSCGGGGGGGGCRGAEEEEAAEEVVVAEEEEVVEEAAEGPRPPLRRRCTRPAVRRSRSRVSPELWHFPTCTRPRGPLDRWHAASGRRCTVLPFCTALSNGDSRGHFAKRSKEIVDVAKCQEAQVVLGVLGDIGADVEFVPFAVDGHAQSGGVRVQPGNRVGVGGRGGRDSGFQVPAHGELCGGCRQFNLAALHIWISLRKSEREVVVGVNAETAFLEDTYGKGLGGAINFYG